MDILIKASIGAVGLVHVFFLTQQIFQFEKTRKTLKNFTDAQLAKTLASNQGLYNGFLAAGMLWGWLSPEDSLKIWTFFLTFIAIAGVYGSLTLTLGADEPAEPRILRTKAFLFQTVPAVIALVSLWVFHG